MFVAPGVAALAITLHGSQVPRTYQDLVKLFTAFVAFERPQARGGAPDYTAAAIAARRVTLKTFQSRLAAIDPAGWPRRRRRPVRRVSARSTTPGACAMFSSCR